MRLERVTSADHKMYETARELYRISFPDHERRSEAGQNKALQSPDYHFNLVYDGEVFVGLALIWSRSQYAYIEHLCVNPQLRNGGYGAKILALVKEQYPKILLDIDPPETEIAIRRKGFYERNGFVANEMEYLFPAYDEKEKMYPMILMSTDRPLSKEEFDEFYSYMIHQIMGEYFAI